MVHLVLILLLLAVVIAVFLWASALFVQGYLYESPPEELYWRAPAAGGVLTLFFAAWCFLNYRASEPGQTELAYDSIFNFTAEQLAPPVQEFWAVKSTDKVHYRLRKLPGTPPRYEYRDVKNVLWPTARSKEVQAIIVKEAGGEVRFTASADHSRYSEEGGNRYMTDESLGQITTPRTGRSIASIMLNLVHFVVWFLCLWLLLRYQWPHALGLAAVMWLGMTLALPYVLAQIPRRPLVGSPAAAASLRRGESLIGMQGLEFHNHDRRITRTR